MKSEIKVYIWGTGKRAEEYLSKNEISKEQLLGFIQTQRSADMFYEKKVFEPQEVVLREKEYILVCVMHSTRTIYDLCVTCNIPVERVFFLDNYEWLDGTPVKEFPDLCYQVVEPQNSQWIKENLPVFYSLCEQREEELARLTITTKTGFDLIDSEDFLQKEEFRSWSYRKDYCRFRTFELLADEIRKKSVKGAVAELGVYKGTFSRLINAKFPDRKLYLFDTFQSFDRQEYSEELEKQRCQAGFIDVFKDTSVEKVIHDMPHSELCIPRVGVFPDTAVGLEEITYSFVSIDVDFEKSIYEGLRYFYPRLSEGGAIFIHDYNNRFLGGVKRAVEKYEESIDKRLMKVPIADEGGTLIILK